ncbi:hypothetical protein DACRYDRAFT_115593 [Dacryopinax primogenitus]|uniref:AB hydrolase-1 domain-containing protein n=1 Tax=Dacryopinax primogenitus (strain DJM 731) TaxID=1858805 RepID=M5G1C7_DACPD|nr:uncharacterized protein DACRYDRAFT_115593 [Dacryopinax primogenitus]EJU02534.1 hypothetical protein DACRYDRAFT_115593 [Dacryopinax primogenitus]
MSDYQPTEIDALVPPDTRPPHYNATAPAPHPTGNEEERQQQQKRHPDPYKRSFIPRLLLFMLLFLLAFVSLLLLLSLLLALIHPGLSVWLPPHRSSTSTPLLLSFISALLSLSSLLTFDTPSIMTRVVLWFCLGCAFLDLILLVSVNSLRHRENWLGISSILLILATLATALGANVYVDKVYKETARAQLAMTPEEAEVRAMIVATQGGYWAGRIKKALKVLLEFMLAFTSAIGLFMITLNLVVVAADSTLDLPYPTSQLVSVQPPPSRWPYNIHIACAGQRNNTVPPSLVSAGKQRPVMLYESMSGIPGTLGGEWVFRLAEEGVERACIWDRPGYGFSDSSPGSDVPHVTEALHSALKRMDESGPFMLIGAGYGGLVTRYFATLYSKQTHSVLYIESQHPSLFYQGPPLSSAPDFWRYAGSALGWSRLADFVRGERPSNTRWWRTVGPNADGLQKVRLDERLQAHRRDSLSSIALNSTYPDYPFHTPTIVLTSRERMDNTSNWQRVQRDIWSGAVGDAKVAWRIVKGTEHDLCKGLRGEGECRRAVEELLLL